MKNYKFIIKFGVLALIMQFMLIQHVKAQLPSSDSAYHLVWADDFSVTNGVRIDTSKWTQRFDWNQADSIIQHPCDTSIDIDVAYLKWYNNTPWDYDIDTINSKVRGGYLTQYCRKENFNYGECWTWPSCTLPSGPNPQCNVSGPAGACQSNGSDTMCWHIQNKHFKYTAANLISKYKFRYGYFEMRFKQPPAVTAPNKYSTSTNFWLWASDGSGGTIPWSEIDIMEKRDSDNWVTNNVHYSHYPDLGKVPLHNQFYAPCNLNDTAWHTIGCLWTSHDIVFYLDGVATNNLVNSSIRPDSLLPMPIIVGLGGPAANFCRIFNSTYSQDYNWKIDYVKVWQIKNACNTAKTFCGTAFNPVTYNSQDSLYKSVTIGGTGCVSQAITNTNFVSVYGNDYVLLNEGFSIDNNSTVVIDVIDCIPNNTPIHTSPMPQPMPNSFKYKLLQHNSQ